MEAKQPMDDIEKLSQPKQAQKARERLIEFVRGDETRAAQVLLRLGERTRTPELKAVDASCREVLGIPPKLKIDPDLETVLDDADELADEDDAEAAGALRRYAYLADPDYHRAGLEWVFHLYYVVDDNERALAELFSLLERFPTFADAHQFACVMLVCHGRQFDLALHHITRAIELNPLESTCWALLALVHGCRSASAESVAAALEALECDRQAGGEDHGWGVRALAGFCLYLFGPDEEREQRLTELAACLGRKETAENYPLLRLVALARERGHSESEWLERLALVVDDEAKPGSLKAWPAYQRAKEAAKQLPKWHPPSDPPDDAYDVALIIPPVGHHVPRLLHEFGRWLERQERGTLGWFDGLDAESLEGWPLDDVARIAANALAFLPIADGSKFVLVNTGSDTPPAVAYMDSEGDSRTVAGSLEEFLVLWSRGETTVYDLDDEDGKKGRKALAKWIATQGITPPKVPSFDFNAWLDTGDGGAASANKGGAAQPAFPTLAADRAPTPIAAKLGPKAAQLAAVMGLRADAPELVKYVTETLGKKVPLSTRNDDVHVTAPKLGLDLNFSHTIHADAYPPIVKTAKSFVPYLSLAWLYPKLGEEVLGVPWKSSTIEDVSKVLGPPASVMNRGSEDEAGVWNIELDSVAHTQLHIRIEPGEFTVVFEVAQARDLERFTDVTTGLFVSYAAERGLLDPTRFEAHAELLGRVAARKAQGSEFVKRALPRGLWDDHLKNDAELRTFAFGWFHNVGKVWIIRDLIKVFGKREGRFGHNEPILDDDTWQAVDRAAPLLDERFAPWL